MPDQNETHTFLSSEPSSLVSQSAKVEFDPSDVFETETDTDSLGVTFTFSEDCYLEFLDYWKDENGSVVAHRYVGGNSSRSIKLYENNSSSTEPAASGRALQGEAMLSGDQMYVEFDGTAAVKGCQVTVTGKR